MTPDQVTTLQYNKNIHPLNQRNKNKDVKELFLPQPIHKAPSSNPFEPESLKMAMEICFQVSTISTPRACVTRTHAKLNLPTYRGLMKTSPLSLPSSSSSFSNAIDHRSRRSLLVCQARETVDKVLVVTDANWKNLVISSETPVLVEFWAPWCGPCRMIAPVVDELAKEYAGKLACYKLNTDDCPTIATEYGIRSIPTVLFFKNGEKKESVIGAVPKSTLSATIEKYVEA